MLWRAKGITQGTLHCRAVRLWRASVPDICPAPCGSCSSNCHVIPHCRLGPHPGLLHFQRGMLCVLCSLQSCKAGLACLVVLGQRLPAHPFVFELLLPHLTSPHCSRSCLRPWCVSQVCCVCSFQWRLSLSRLLEKLPALCRWHVQTDSVDTKFRYSPKRKHSNNQG